MNDVLAAIRMMVALNPAPIRRRDVARCETATLNAFRSIGADSIKREAQAALRLRCWECRFKDLSPILSKAEKASR